MTFCNRVPVQGVLQKSIFASWHTRRAFFLCSPQCVGITIYMNFRSPSSYSIWAVRVPQIRFRVKFVFSRPPLRKCTLFLLDDSSAGMGTIIFHQNHRNSFGVTNSNMKTLAGSKKITFIDMLSKTVIFPFDTNKIMVFRFTSINTRNHLALQIPI